jgi:hypothetical protein
VALDLAQGAPARLVFHTGAVAYNDNRRDWSYVAAMHFDVPSEK